MVTNCGKEDFDGCLTANRKALGLAPDFQASQLDTLQDQAYSTLYERMPIEKTADGGLQLSIPKHDFCLVLIEPAAE